MAEELFVTEFAIIKRLVVIRKFFGVSNNLEILDILYHRQEDFSVHTDLSPTGIEVFHLLMVGCKHKKIQTSLSISRGGIRYYQDKISELYNCTTLKELTGIYYSPIRKVES